MHALIIDPQVLISLMLQQELRDLGFTSFDTATTQSRAVEAARRKTPDLVTAGLRLVRGNGVDAVAAICKDQPIPTLFVVSNAEEAKSLVGDMPIITKPVLKSELHQAVQRTMQRSDRSKSSTSITAAKA
ncbi:hypothetical protein A9995_11455 [Erythrobacter sp. QSSC1-22B]|uniref:response regulator n=1 Tax=Erythrobacter sp. QSSC1-22B TaxID=1860125 RepID=UPI000804B0FE|nr:response regulator [Erythrobacter sp. QSSC1-22B]OBX18576.1 hypothetical protein A9995_11455 [Erythrobacter sp. QSSC1-22B]